MKKLFVKYPIDKLDIYSATVVGCLLLAISSFIFGAASESPLLLTIAASNFIGFCLTMGIVDVGYL